jgi:hypothetical protein
VAWPDDAVFVGADGDLHVVAQGGDGDPKEAALAAARCLNPHPEQVTDPEFLASEFFDARDPVQVKYEMVRKVRAGGPPVTEAAAAFGYSQPANYAASAALESAGLEGLAAARPGPRGGHKITDEVCAWAEEQLARYRERHPQKPLNCPPAGRRTRSPSSTHEYSRCRSTRLPRSQMPNLPDLAREKKETRSTAVTRFPVACCQAVQIARRRTSQTVAAMRSTDSASSQAPSIHWMGQNRLPG